ncbi:MAG: translocation/assembly module TamB domain-containing protein, partial [Bacteroidota bacterium]
TENIIYRGNITADFPVTNPDSLQGKLFITHSLLVKDAQRIQMDTIQVIAGHTDSGQYVNLNSDVINASLNGRYKITELGKIFQQAIQPYFAVNDKDSIAIKEPYDFRLTAEIINKPVLKTLIPNLQRLDSISLISHFTSNNGWNALLNAPVIEIGTNHIKNLRVNAATKNERLEINANVQQFTNGSSLALYNTKVDALIKDNKIDFDINIKDKEEKEKYNLAGLFEQPRKDSYRFSLRPDSLLLNYERWNIAQGNNIELTKTKVLAHNFNLDKNDERLEINSDSTAEGSPLKVSFNNFKLETITGFVQSDSTLIGGRLNGTAVVHNVLQQPVFTSDLTITDLNIKRDTAGNVKMLVSNKTADTYTADVTITGRGNDVALSGNYYANNPDNSFDLLLDLKQLPMKTVEAFSQGAIREGSGSINGKFNVKGNTKQPKIVGDLNFAHATFKPSQLNNYFLIDNEKIQVDEQGIRFDHFSIKDSSNNELTLNGSAATTNFTNYKFDFTIRSDNFQALNSTKKDNKLFYGKLYFNSNLNVKGTEEAPVIDGRLTVNDKTKLTIVLPQKEPGVSEREGVIEFIDMDAPADDSLFLKTYDTLNTFALKGMDIAANIEIKKEAELNLIVDEGSGDFLNVRGEALLTAGVDPSGKITLAGSYELEDGSYQLTFNLLRRKFNIQKGSKIVWAGEPTDADVNIKAAYETNTAPLDLVKNQLGPDVAEAERNKYLQKLPFQVFLKMNGKLLQPIITFDVVLPENKDYNVSPDIVSTVRTKLEMLRLDEGELNKQVFALLLLNRFVGENPFNSSGSSPTAETLIRQSASKLLTEQLNKLAENLVQGVDLNFDVESSDDYSTGQRQDRTDLNVGVSKRLLNDRLTVTVGSNFELEGVQNSNRKGSNIAGNVALNYRLSKDGRYMLRAYRKNEYEGVLDGYIIETGVGFIITIDYNKFKEIFQKKKPRKARQKTSDQKEKTQTAAVPANATDN